MRSNPVIVGCEGRTGYLSWDGANKALSRGRFRNKGIGGKMNIYRCRQCAHWHVGRSN